MVATSKGIARGGFTPRTQVSRPSGAFFRESTVRTPREVNRQAERSPQEPPLLSEQRVAEFLADLSPDRRAKVNRIIDGQTRLMGYQQVRPGGTVWQKAERRVVTNLLAHEVDLDEIQFDEPDIKVESTGEG